MALPPTPHPSSSSPAEQIMLWTPCGVCFCWRIGNRGCSAGIILCGEEGSAEWSRLVASWLHKHSLHAHNTRRFEQTSCNKRGYCNNGIVFYHSLIYEIQPLIYLHNIEKHPWITYSDLWILAGVCAIQEMQGPALPYRPGRQDKDMAACTPDGRLPDASKGNRHLRDIFGRMGFNDQEIVALSGALALGRCHTDRSGFSGPWTFSPTVVTNDYYKLLLEEKWTWKKWNGPAQVRIRSTL